MLTRASVHMITCVCICMSCEGRPAVPSETTSCVWHFVCLHKFCAAWHGVASWRRGHYVCCGIFGTSRSLFPKKKVLRHKINLSLSRALGLDPYDSAESKPNLVRICPQEIANEARVRHVSGASDAFDLHCVTQKVKWWNGPQRPQRPQPPHILTWHYPETWSKLLISGERPPGKWWVLVTRPASLFAQCLFLHSLLIPTKHNKTSYWLQSEYIVEKKKKEEKQKKKSEHWTHSLQQVKTTSWMSASCKQGTMHAHNLLINDGLIPNRLYRGRTAAMRTGSSLSRSFLVRSQVTHTDMQLNTSQNCFHNLMLYRRLHSSAQTESASYPLTTSLIYSAHLSPLVAQCRRRTKD